MIEPASVKERSEAAILAASGKICEWLPTIGVDDLALRSPVAVAQRALVLNALVNISFGAPKEVILRWLTSNGLAACLSGKERAIVTKPGVTTEPDRHLLRWNIESLWSMAWVAGFTEDLSPTQSISDQLAGFFPDLQINESAGTFNAKVRLRSIEELYEKLDLFYRAHWYARDCRLKGAADTSFNEGVMQFRRVSLEWVLHEKVDWDEVDLST